MAASICPLSPVSFGSAGRNHPVGVTEKLSGTCAVSCLQWFSYAYEQVQRRKADSWFLALNVQTRLDASSSDLRKFVSRRSLWLRCPGNNVQVELDRLAMEGELRGVVLLTDKSRIVAHARRGVRIRQGERELRDCKSASVSNALVFKVASPTEAHANDFPRHSARARQRVAA